MHQFYQDMNCDVNTTLCWKFNLLSCRDLLLCLINFEVCKFSFCDRKYFRFIIYSISFDIRNFRFAIGESIWILYDVGIHEYI